MGYYRHVVHPDNHMTPPEWGEKVNQCQEDSSQLQAVYVPGEELSCPNSARRSVLEDHAPACQGCIRCDHLATWIGSILTPLWRKKGNPRTRHIKRVRKQLRDTLLGEWLVLWSGPLKFSSTKGTASCEATPGAWGLRASDKCSRRHNGLAWSRPNVYWGWKSGQEPDGPTFEQNPSELPKTLRWEGERTPLFVVHSEAKSMNMAEDDINVTTHWLPGVGQNGSWVNECPGTSKGPEQHPCTLWTSLVPKLGQREETCFGTPSLQKRTEGTSCAAEWPKYEHRHLSGQQWQTSLPLESVT